MTPRSRSNCSICWSTDASCTPSPISGKNCKCTEVVAAVADRGPASPKFANWFGTTIRIYDPTIKAWRANWFNPHDGIRAELIGRRRGNEIVQEGTFPDGTPIRWTFSEITDDSFRWRGARLEPDGKTWRLQVEFHGRRMA